MYVKIENAGRHISKILVKIQFYYIFRIIGYVLFFKRLLLDIIDLKKKKLFQQNFLGYMTYNNYPTLCLKIIKIYLILEI